MASKIPEMRNIESLLSKYLPSNTKILKQETKMLTAPGENYGSVILAVEVTTKQCDDVPTILHLVAKLIPANEMLCEMFNVQETFKKEISMYLEAIPALIKFQEEYDIQDRKISELFARCYGGRINLQSDSNRVDKDAVLFLENLKISGFDVGDRLVGFNLDHARKIIEDLATFHAVPIAMKLLQLDVFNKKVLPFAKGVKVADGIDEKIKNMIVSEVVNILKTNDKCVPYLDKVAETINYNFSGDIRCNMDREPFATLIHTDYWVNNTMIQKDETGNPVKNILVDLQMVSYGSGTHDLLFFLYSSVQPEILYKNLDALIKYYYDSFIECLRGYDIDLSMFSWDSFNNEIQETAFAELGHLLIMYKPILTERGTIDDMSNLNMDDLVRSDRLNPDYEKRIIDCVLSFIDNKWLQS